MEKARENENKCFICDDDILNDGKDIFCNYTTFSVTLLSTILERFIGHQLAEPSKVCLICSRCQDKINKYDFAFATAEQVQKELTELLLKTEQYYRTIGESEGSDSDTIQVVSDGTAYIIKEEYGYHDEVSGKAEDVNQYDVHLFTSLSKESENSTDSKIEFVERLEEESSEEYTSIEESVLVEVVASPPSPLQEGKLEESLEGNSKHNASKRNTTCYACGVKFSKSKELREHWKQKHDTGDRAACDLCGVTYKSQAALNIHLGMHKGISPFKCDVCGKKFTQKGALKRHKPIHTGERPYQCEKCGKRFVHYSSFHMHTLAHDDVRDKKCDICGLLLRSTSHLKRHKLVHSGLKPHACPVCDQRFAQRYNMTTHLRSHEGIQTKRKHVCVACNRGFSSGNLLRAHVERTECLSLKNNKIVSNRSDDPIIMYEELITPDS